jgi:serine/threonine protein kinase
MSLSPIFCSECGAQNVPGAKFCVTCGHVMYIPVVEMPPSTGNSPGTGLLPQDSLLNNRYRIRKLVGTGGMGAVYKGEDARYGDRLLAIKEMRQSSLNPHELEIATEQFKIEAIMLARLQHPSLPRIYDHFLEVNRWYLVMDFIEGETLDERLRRTPGRKLPPPEVIDIGLQLCKVLDYLHNRQPPVIFRDLKPSNVMLTPEGHLYLIDFGIARIFKPGQAKDTKAYGSIGYSAPEQFDREQTTAQADIYSLGITMHEMLSGNIPSLTPFHLPRLNFPGQPALERLGALIMQMIELDKDKRPASIEKVRQELESIRDALKQALYISSTAQSAAPPTQYTPQPSQESARVAPTEYVPPPIAATIAVPSFTESAPRPVVAVPPRRSAARRNVLVIGKTGVVATLVGIISYAIVTFILGKIFVGQATAGSFLLSAIFPDEGSHSYTVVWGDFVLGIFFFIPCFFGVKYGLLAGLAVGLIGTLLGDVTSQFLPAWYWFAGFAALGFISGLAYIRTRGTYSTAGNILLALGFSTASIVIWAVIRLSGDFASETQSFGIPFTNVLTLVLVQLVSLIPLLILLIASNVFTKARVS